MFFDLRHVQKSVTQIIYLGPLPTELESAQVTVVSMLQPVELGKIFVEMASGATGPCLPSQVHLSQSQHCKQTDIISMYLKNTHICKHASIGITMQFMICATIYAHYMHC